MSRPVPGKCPREQKVARGMTPAYRGAMRLLVATLLALALAGCNDSVEDNVVGARCTQATDCRFMCETPSNEFPGGFCTVRCADDTQCPHGTVCMATDGGVCLFPCGNDVDCGFLGAGWLCQNRDRASGGRRLVCIGG
jgi:hypothetical protein